MVSPQTTAGPNANGQITFDNLRPDDSHSVKEGSGNAAENYSAYVFPGKFVTETTVAMNRKIRMNGYFCSEMNLIWMMFSLVFQYILIGICFIS